MATTNFTATVRVVHDRHGNIEDAAVIIEGAKPADVDMDSELWARIQVELDFALGTDEGDRIRAYAREHPSLSIGERNPSL